MCEARLLLAIEGFYEPSGQERQEKITSLKRTYYFSWPYSLRRDVLMRQKSIEPILIKVFLDPSSRSLDVLCIAYESIHWYPLRVFGIGSREKGSCSGHILESYWGRILNIYY